MAKKLQGKVAIVTGASKGIGASIAKYYGLEGASVAVNYSSSKEGADKVVDDILKGGGQAIAVHADMRKPEEIKALFGETIKKFGKVDILVNNAGVYEFAPLDHITIEQYHKMFDLNVLGLILASQEAAKHIKEGGSIINISSVASKLSSPNTTVYSATKAAVDSITKTLSKELGAKKIRVNSINPGMVETEGVAVMENTKDFRQHVLSQTPLGRVGQVEDISPAAVFLASDEASWITGESFFISGGLNA
jgi:3-oxoacyl-[acyl-carrier protein] reductase